jgi:hypothetical protein
MKKIILFCFALCTSTVLQGQTTSGFANVDEVYVAVEFYGTAGLRENGRLQRLSDGYYEAEARSIFVK